MLKVTASSLDKLRDTVLLSNILEVNSPFDREAEKKITYVAVCLFVFTLSDKVSRKHAGKHKVPPQYVALDSCLSFVVFLWGSRGKGGQAGRPHSKPAVPAAAPKAANGFH